MRSVLCSLVCLVGICLGATIRGTLQPTAHLDAATSLSPSTVLRLTSAEGEYSTHFLTSGDFAFDDVPPAEYVLHVVSLSHVFKSVKIVVARDDVSVSVYRLVRGQAWSEPTAPLPYPLVLRAEGIVDYYMPRPALDPLALLRNPMALIGIFMALSVFGLPAVTKYLDPDGIEEMERMKRDKAEQQRTARAEAPVVDNPVEKLTNFDISGWLAGKK